LACTPDLEGHKMETDRREVLLFEGIDTQHKGEYALFAARFVEDVFAGVAAHAGANVLLAKLTGYNYDTWEAAFPFAARRHSAWERKVVFRARRDEGGVEVDVRAFSSPNGVCFDMSGACTITFNRGSAVLETFKWPSVAPDPTSSAFVKRVFRTVLDAALRQERRRAQVMTSWALRGSGLLADVKREVVGYVDAS